MCSAIELFHLNLVIGHKDYVHRRALCVTDEVLTHQKISSLHGDLSAMMGITTCQNASCAQDRTLHPKVKLLCDFGHRPRRLAGIADDVFSQFVLQQVQVNLASEG